MSDAENNPLATDVEIITTVAPSPTDSAQVFRQIPAVGRFAIPISGRAIAEEIVIKTRGMRLHRGDVLVEQWPESSAAPLAPANGRIAGLGCAKLSARVTIPAILFEPDAAVPIIEPASLTTADTIPNMLRWLRETDLAGGIQLLRKHGVWADRWTTPDLLGQLRECIESPVDAVICNVLDESPDLLLHHELAKAFPVELVAGALALAQMTGARRRLGRRGGIRRFGRLECIARGGFRHEAQAGAASGPLSAGASDIVDSRNHRPPCAAHATPWPFGRADP